ncbi:hypothetical protein F1337_17465 [Clostridioides difficile]|nr:hypothetical protein [Clostridioides difficile]
MELDFKFIGQRIKIARIKKKLTQEVLRDCNEYEIRFITDIVKASKKSIRDIKLFQSNLNDRY